MQDLSAYLNVVNAARTRMHIQDFYVGGRLSLQIAHGYEARKQILEELLKCGLVVINDSHLSIGILNENKWLLDGLEIGLKDAWDIVDAFPKRSRKFDPDSKQLVEIGMKGELFVIDELKRILPENTHSRIRQISLTDDSAGFDITAPSIKSPDKQIFLEVKTSTRPGENFNFYLSRNEFETAEAYENWYLVLVRLNDSKGSLFGHLEGSSLLSYFPKDTNQGFTWMSSSGSFTKDDLRIYLP